MDVGDEKGLDAGDEKGSPIRNGSSGAATPVRDIAENGADVEKGKVGGRDETGIPVSFGSSGAVRDIVDNSSDIKE